MEYQIKRKLTEINGVALDFEDQETNFRLARTILESIGIKGKISDVVFALNSSIYLELDNGDEIVVDFFFEDFLESVEYGKRYEVVYYGLTELMQCQLDLRENAVNKIYEITEETCD